MRAVGMQYLLLLQWQLLRMKSVLPFFMVIQVVIGTGTVIGLGFLMPEIDQSSALYLVTGGPTLTLITVGLVIVPQMIAEDKGKGTLVYMWSLPISRWVYVLADVTVWTAAALPGMSAALVLGSWYYGFQLTVSPMILPVLLLVSAASSCVGYAVAYLQKNEQMTLLITNVIIFSLFLFSPINYPLEQLPEALQQIHRILPIVYMADLVRTALTGIEGMPVLQALAVVTAWFCICFLLVVRALQKRG